jgi:predicted  nucleic acid-binding Zn-ribbon protein
MLKAELEEKVKELEEKVEFLNGQLDDLNGAYSEMENENYDLWARINNNSEGIHDINQFLSKMKENFSEEYYNQFIQFLEEYQRYYNE